MVILEAVILLLSSFNPWSCSSQKKNNSNVHQLLKAELLMKPLNMNQSLAWGRLSSGTTAPLGHQRRALAHAVLWCCASCGCCQLAVLCVKRSESPLQGMNSAPQESCCEWRSTKESSLPLKATSEVFRYADLGHMFCIWMKMS